MSKSYFTWGREQPAKGQKVRFSVYVPSCVPGNKPLADYQGKGEYLGECADGLHDAGDRVPRAGQCWRSDLHAGLVGR